MARNRRPQLPFSRKLALYRWLLGLFGVDRFEDLSEHLRDEALEGLDPDNVHRFHHALCLHLPPEGRPELPDDLLLAYDQAIVAVTGRLNERRRARGEPLLTWKYFQYLALLFTEIYLDRYFRDPGDLRGALNGEIEALNASAGKPDRITPLDEGGEARSQLNKLSFWMATGSGKTLLMHAHILQYRRHLEAHGRARELNRIILLTPNEGLSQQHLREFEAAGIPAEVFSKDARGLFAGQTVEILEVTKLKEEMGEKTVAVEAFEGNNLVLVDEGHRGASAGEEGTWMRFRNALCERGFSFEYSATFGQAVKGSQALTDQYARSILFDYSYRWFFQDGFGKDYQILNLEDDSDPEWMNAYLTASLLAFYQQQRLHRDREAEIRPFNLERPLWVFVGGSVTATLAKRDASDIVAILRFFSHYLANREESIARIEGALKRGLVTARGENLFQGRFAYLNGKGLSPAGIFENTLALLFNAPAGGSLHVENLKGATGEIALRVGDNEPFGVINVGDDAKLLKLCEREGFHVAVREFAGSLFHELDRPHSSVHLLIGSKKFTEGWNSWRVSTMGLMNVGRGEGAQIIQLFGRGVRLKGYGMSLKRSARTELPEGLEKPKHLETLETLHIFGVRANYMAQFRDFLKEEGLQPNAGRVEIVIPIEKRLGSRPLKTIRLKKMIQGVSTESADAFRKLGPISTLEPPTPDDDLVADYLRRNRVVLNWYPKVRAMTSAEEDGKGGQGQANLTNLTPAHVAFLDLDRLFLEIEEFKAQRGWHNLNLSREGIRKLLLDSSWYDLLIPESELAFDGFGRALRWKEIALALLKKYTERYYTFRRREWELPHLEYQEVLADDPNFHVAREEGPEYGYRIVADESQKELVEKLKELKKLVADGRLRALAEAGQDPDWSHGGIQALWFGQHLYQPLLFAEEGGVEITPAPLNKGERRFVEDLRAFCETESDDLEGQEIYLLRNLSRGRGIGFFEAANFHPDFILWILSPGWQHVAFVDPKGIRNLPWDDPKIRFHETVKEIQGRLGDPEVVLDAFLVSNTPSHVMEREWRASGITRADMEARHILFQEEGRERYVEAILRGMAGR